MGASSHFRHPCTSCSFRRRVRRLESEDGDRQLGQVLTMRPESELAPDLGLEGLNTSMLMRFARGEGVILDGDLRPFHDAMARPADPREVSAWLD
jgi:hypothetical protein